MLLGIAAGLAGWEYAPGEGVPLEVPPSSTGAVHSKSAPPAKDASPADRQAKVIAPWRALALDPEFGGAWVVAGDLDGDGVPEIVSAQNKGTENVNQKAEFHFTSAVVAQRLDGGVLWRWGDPKIGRKKLHHDVACQIYDWDGDGKNEVVLCGDGFLSELDGATGREKRRLPLPKDAGGFLASDSLSFVNLSGNSRPTDVLVKTRYTQIWAFDRNWKQLWTIEKPGGYRTAHQPVAVDLDGDGRDEIMAGFAMLNADGSTRWAYKSQKMQLRRGHCDCFRLVRAAEKTEDARFVLTMCGAKGIALLDGNGKPIWEVGGQHFESVDVGHIFPGAEDRQLAVDMGVLGDSPLWVFDERGQVHTKIKTHCSRFHALLDWTGDGLDEILVADSRSLYDGQGRVVATFAMNAGDAQDMDAKDYTRGGEPMAMTGDFTGDGVPDVLLTTHAMTHLYIYKNERGKRPTPPAPLGTRINFSLY
ncbi:MAG: hypothetical protein IT426_17745 [Pirellulales bacterium]|nr:hypothetical protein [Pirellulales bacterium]